MVKYRWKLRQPHPAGSPIPGTLNLGKGKTAFNIEVDENGFFETDGLPDFPLYAIAEAAPDRIDDIIPATDLTIYH